MNEQLFQFIMYLVALGVSIIGFLLVKSVFNRFDAHTERMNKHSERMDNHEERISNNTKSIEKNSERDSLIREMMDKNMSELKGSVDKLSDKFDNNSTLLQEVLINLKSKSK